MYMCTNVECYALAGAVIVSIFTAPSTMSSSHQGVCLRVCRLKDDTSVTFPEGLRNADKLNCGHLVDAQPQRLEQKVLKAGMLNGLL